MDYIQNGTSTNTTMSCQTRNVSLLRSLNDDMFQQLAPVVAILVAFMVVGTVGNILICYIFIRKLQRSSQNFLLLCLGTFDLLSSCVGVPSEIMDISQYYLYESAEACKAMRFLTTFPSLASIMVLLVIATDRYRRICKPLYHQIHLYHARIALVIIVILAAGFSVPALFLYGHRTVPTHIPGEYGCDCSVNDIYQGKKYPLIYEGTFFAAFVISAAALVFIYTRIWFETRRHIKYMKTHAIFGSVLLDEILNTSSVTYDEPVVENKSGDISQLGTGKLPVKPMHKKRIYNCLNRKSRRKSEIVHGGDDTMELRNNPTVSDPRLECERGEEAHSESHYYNLQVNGNVQDESKNFSGELSEMCELAPIHKQIHISAVSASHKLARSSTDNFSDRDVTTKTFETTGISEGAIIFDNNQNCESSTDDGDLDNGDLWYLENNQIKSDVDLPHTPDSLKTAEDEQDHEVLMFHYDQEIFNPEQQHYKNNDVSDNQLSGVISADTESKCSDELSTSENLRSTPFNMCTDIDHSVTNRISSSQYSNLSHAESDLRLSDYGNMHSEESMQVSEDQLQEPREESMSYANKQMEETCLNSIHDKSHDDTDCLGMSQINLDSETNSGHSHHNYSESQEDHLSGATKIQNIRSNRVSFANELNFLEYVGDLDNSQVRRFSSEILTPESHSHKLLRKTSSNQSLLTTHRAKKALRATRMTIIAFVITVGFILSYLPHLILVIIRSVITNYERDLHGVSLNVYNIFLRSYFANNVINVFVYGCMHLEFRSHMAALWRRIKHSK